MTNKNEIADRIIEIERRKEFLSHLERNRSNARISWDYGTQDESAAVPMRFCSSCGYPYVLLDNGCECEQCAILSRYKKAQIEMRLLAMGMGEPITPKPPEEKPMNKFKAFFHRDPVKQQSFIFIWTFIFLSFLLFVFLEGHYKNSTAAIVYVLFLFISIGLLVTDVIRTKNQIARSINKDQ